MMCCIVGFIIEAAGTIRNTTGSKSDYYKSIIPVQLPVSQHQSVQFLNQVATSSAEIFAQLLN